MFPGANPPDQSKQRNTITPPLMLVHDPPRAVVSSWKRSTTGKKATVELSIAAVTRLRRWLVDEYGCVWAGFRVWDCRDYCRNAAFKLESCPVTHWHTCRHIDVSGWSLFTSLQRALQSQTISNFIIPLLACTSMPSSQAYRATFHQPQMTVHTKLFIYARMYVPILWNTVNEVCWKNEIN